MTAPMMVPDVDISEDVDTFLDGPDDTGDDMAHIILKKDWEKGYIFGQEVTALCGKKWIPVKDAENLPVCGSCQIAAATRSAS